MKEDKVKVISSGELIKRARDGQRKLEEGKVFKTFNLAGIDVTLALPSPRQLEKELRAAQAAELNPSTDIWESMANARTSAEARDAYQKFVSGQVEREMTGEDAEAKVYMNYVTDIRDPRISSDGKPMILVRDLNTIYLGEDLDQDAAVVVDDEVREVILNSVPALVTFVKRTLGDVTNFYHEKKEAELGNSATPPDGSPTEADRAASAGSEPSTAPGANPSATSPRPKRNKSSKTT